MIIKFIIVVIYFLFLYLMALAASWNCRWGEDEFHFLGISDRLWRAILIMWAPSLILFTP